MFFSTRQTVALAMMLSAGCFSGAHAQTTSLGTGFDYSTGKYGGNVSTDITYVPLIGKYEQDRLTLKLTVPYIRISGPSNVVGGTSGAIVTGNNTNQRRTAQGQGDIVGAASYTAFEDAKANLAVDVTGKVKFATADKDKGLGTGENDYTLQADVYRTVGQTTFFGGAGRRFMGKPQGLNFRDISLGSLGFSQKIGKESSGGVIYDYRQSVVAGRKAQQELTAYFATRLDKQIKGQIYLTGGLNDNSVDSSVGGVVTYSF